jgi:hypothetical protein
VGGFRIWNSGKRKTVSLARFAARAHRAHRERKAPKCYRMVLELISSWVFSADPAGSAREKFFISCSLERE